MLDKYERAYLRRVGSKKGIGISFSTPVEVFDWLYVRHEFFLTYKSLSDYLRGSSKGNIVIDNVAMVKREIEIASKYSTIKTKALGRAKLIKLEKGTQTYEYEDGERSGKHEILRGLNAASDVLVGDTGVMVYESGRSWGLPFFVKDKV